MSSQQTENELSPVKSASEECAYRRARFVRTTSLEKIRFICSKHYYILPAILTHLRASHSLVSNTFNMFVFLIHDSTNAACRLIRQRFLSTMVYMTITAVFIQLVACLYLLASVFIPAGLIFLITCLYLISHINLSCLQYFLEKEQKSKMATSDKVKMTTTKTTRLSRRDILGKRTISNFDFF